MKPAGSKPIPLHDHLARAAAHWPERPALIVGERTWTFADLASETADGMPAGTGPVASSDSSLELALAAYRCSAQRRPFFPLPPERFTPALDDCPPHTALIISTSGSEGQPRAVLLDAAQLDAAAAAANASLGLEAGDVWLNCLPLYHIGGQSILWRCARAAAGVLLHDGFAADKVARDLVARPVTHISLVPAMLARLLDLGSAPPASLRAVLIGGAALSAPLYERATAAGWPLYVSYGMSETAAQVATFAPDDGPWHEGLVGHPMPGHEVRIGDDGRIQIRGPQVMAGYLDASGIDADGRLTTGDLGCLDAGGRLTVLGRADDMLISGGRNVHPQEIESCLAGCPGVVDVAVTGLPDPVWGDLVVALIVGAIDNDSLLAHARRHLPAAALPRRIHRLDRLPRNAAGKLERAALRHLAAGAAA
ncbi:AMP-binding protein [Dechloromonas sp. XY25]|uniref:AMP-binding protein n=1 Tax=Dechloromonas hankyongensis TaxID=2908002 RepID=A0ABS9K4D0_9RHOO|nr:AMP-binding protein [Dechloromonas hankyongensis]MCG2578032.1 AMP-binding protein [Dechloromonas hankyongensis]